MRKKDKIIIWPVYFDSTKTKKQGRRIPKNLAIPSPKINQIKEVVERMKVDHEFVQDAKYPKMPWTNTGIITVEKRDPKSRMLKRIAEHLFQDFREKHKPH